MDRFVGSSQGNPECRVLVAQQYNGSVEHRHRGMIQSGAEEVAVVETPSLRCFQCARGKETHPSLRLNLDSVEFMSLSGFNASGHATNCQILLACNLKVFRMV